MAPTVHNDVLDAALDEVATATAVHVCTAEPADHAGIAAVSVANYTVTAGDGNGDWTVGEGDTSGRKLTLGAQSGNNGTGDGAGDYIAMTDGATLLLTIEGDGDTVNNGSPVTIAETDVYELADPTSEA